MRPGIVKALPEGPTFFLPAYRQGSKQSFFPFSLSAVKPDA
jgi:hypothetical protein